MSKFIKWELRNYFKKMYKLGIFLAAIYALALLVINTEVSDTVMNLVMVPFGVSIFVLMVMVYVEGTRVIINTYRKKTFLLESMIAYSPAKLLLTKYLMAFIINISYAVLLFLGYSILMSAVDINVFEAFSELFRYIDVFDAVKIIIYMIVSAVGFTSLIVFVYILIRSYSKKNKGNIFIGFIVWWVITVIQNEILSSISGGVSDISFIYSNSYFIIAIIINLVLIVLYFFGTVKLIKDKLEIYS